MMMHHLLLSELECSRTGVIGSTTGEWSASSAAVPCFAPVNTPCATSRDVRSSGILDVFENHPPGKRREEVVDSRRLRGETGDASGERAVVVSNALFSSRGGRDAALNLLRVQLNLSGVTVWAVNLLVFVRNFYCGEGFVLMCFRVRRIAIGRMISLGFAISITLAGFRFSDSRRSCKHSGASSNAGTNQSCR